jgi:hypothetical protein
MNGALRTVRLAAESKWSSRAGQLAITAVIGSWSDCV